MRMLAISGLYLNYFTDKYVNKNTQQQDYQQQQRKQYAD